MYDSVAPHFSWVKSKCLQLPTICGIPVASDVVSWYFCPHSLCPATLLSCFWTSSWNTFPQTPVCPPHCLVPSLAQVLLSQGVFSRTASLNPALAVPCPALLLSFYKALITSEQTASFTCWGGLLFNSPPLFCLLMSAWNPVWHLVGIHNNLPVDCMVEWVRVFYTL